MKKFLLLGAGMLAVSASAVAQEQLYVVGACNGWDINNGSIVLTKTAAGVFSGELNIDPSQAQFRFYSVLGDWETNSYGAAAEGDNIEVSFDNNAFNGAVYESKANYQFKNWPAGAAVKMTVDLNTMKVEATYDPSQVKVEYPAQLYLIGSPTGWNIDSKDMVLKCNADGQYYGLFNIPAGAQYFRFYSETGNWDKGSYGPRFYDGDNEPLAFVKDVFNGSISTGKGSWMTSAKWPGGEIGMSVDLTTGKVTFTSYANIPAVEAPENLYLLGDIDGNVWNPATAEKLTKDGKVFTIKNVKLSAENGTCYFNFSTVAAEDWDVLNNTDRFGALSKDEAVKLGEAMDVVAYEAGFNASGCQSWSIAPGEYDFTVSFEGKYPELTVTTSGTTGVEEIGVENASARYFNLQGVEVANPEKGIFIKVAGNKAVKVAL